MLVFIHFLLGTLDGFRHRFFLLPESTTYREAAHKILRQVRKRIVAIFPQTLYQCIYRLRCGFSQNHNKLIPTYPAALNSRFLILVDYICCPQYHLIPLIMTEGIVHQFQIINIQIDNADSFLFPNLRQQFMVIPLVVKLGHAVMIAVPCGIDKPCRRNQNIILHFLQRFTKPFQLISCSNMNLLYYDILGVKVPSMLIPVMPGRNLAVILETAAINNRQKEMGYNAAKELLTQLGLADDITK